MVVDQATGETLLDRAKALVRRMSRAEIAQHLTVLQGREVTRMAVIGKLDRTLGSKKRPARPPTTRKIYMPPRRPITPSNVIALPKLKDRLPAPIESTLPAGAKAKPTLLVTKNGKLHANDHFTGAHCHFPIGDPLAPDFHFCGKKAVPLKPYCDEHCRKAFTTAAEAKAGARPAQKLPVLEPT